MRARAVDRSSIGSDWLDVTLPDASRVIETVPLERETEAVMVAELQALCCVALALAV